MKKWIIVFLLLIIIPVSGGGFSLFAQTSNECNDKTGQEKIDCLNNVLNRLSGQGKTLNQEIAKRKTQINLTAAQISKTEQEIAALAEKIGRLEVSLEQLAEIVRKRIAATYKSSKPDPVILLFSSAKFSDFVNSYQYLKVVQQHDKKLLYAMETTRTNYDEQKKAVEILKAKLEAQRTQLAKQQREMESLLVVTQNDEKKYQQLLAQAYAEKAALEQALVAGTKVGPIKKGDPIALIGNTGYPICSTGKHLHFEIRKNNTWTDPGAYLQSKTVEDDQNNGGNNVNFGSGSWPWPIEDPVRVTQFYGHTPYSWKYKYSDGIHTGLDIVTSATDVIRAPADGNLFKSSQLCGSSVINIVYIDHGDNLISFYLHVQ
jgi:peptidoglycan hydrolase CwlO-like protein